MWIIFQQDYIVIRFWHTWLVFSNSLYSSISCAVERRVMLCSCSVSKFAKHRAWKFQYEKLAMLIESPLYLTHVVMLTDWPRWPLTLLPWRSSCVDQIIYVDENHETMKRWSGGINPKEKAWFVTGMFRLTPSLSTNSGTWYNPMASTQVVDVFVNDFSSGCPTS